MQRLQPSPRITRLSWGHLEIEGARAFKDAKLYPAAAGKGPPAGLKAIALLARANPTGSTAATGRDKPDLGGMIGSWKTP